MCNQRFVWQSVGALGERVERKELKVNAKNLYKFIGQEGQHVEKSLF